MMLKFFHISFHFMATHLLIEGIKKLLPCRCSTKGGAVVKGSPKTSEIDISFCGSVKCAPEAIHHLDNQRGR